MNELAAFLESVRRCRDDDMPRLAFADWLDENHPEPAVRRGELPKGFNAHWHENVMYLALGVRDMPRGGRAKWSNAEILAGLAASARAIGVKWADRAGAADVAGYPVLLAEPAIGERRALDACRDLQWAAGGCPVSLSRTARRGRVRIGIWFTALPPESERGGEVAAALERMFRGETLGPSPVERIQRRLRRAGGGRRE